MTTFVNEQVKKLDSALSNHFEKNLIATKSLDLSTLSEKDQFLFQASQALDFSNNQLPSFESVQEYLEKYQTTYKDDSSVYAEIEWLFVAKCTIAIYGQVFSNVLNSTLPTSEAIDYWNDIHGNTLQEIYYVLQSNDYVLSQLFPIHASIKPTSNYVSNKTEPFSALNFFTLSSFHNRPLILEIIRHEVALKKRSLQQLRSQQAASLGVLLLTPPQFDQGQADFAVSMADQTKGCIEMIKYVMGSPTGLKQDTDKLQQRNVHHLQRHLDSMSDLQCCSASDITAELYDVVKNWSTVYNRNLKSEQASYGIPSAMTRYWIPTVVSYFVGNWIIQYGLKRKEDIIHCVEELGNTVRDFALNWVWKPVLKVYETIRLKDQRLSILSKQGLQSDLDSLERMMLGFAKDNLHLSELELSRLSSDIREGDMSVLLKEYEKEIKNPLKNVIAGDLLQTMLIQVQKTKVDVDLAMSALDKLLKSNELNFAFLAVAPSMLLTWASVSWLKNTFQGRSQQKMKKIGLPMRETLR
ncbi:ATP synthase regulation protein NCA2-domain-containing protein [Thamnidium elegans]|nr:ATP synthase regulation protein NCA2-domain-containing protein [Thamnidium elegans]